jgi:hypothetical protein
MWHALKEAKVEDSGGALKDLRGTNCKAGLVDRSRTVEIETIQRKSVLPAVVVVVVKDRKVSRVSHVFVKGTKSQLLTFNLT